MLALWLLLTAGRLLRGLALAFGNLFPDGQNISADQAEAYPAKSEFQEGNFILPDLLDRLLDRNLWLDMGRKRPIPHESWFQVAGYFYYYGHYYGALCLEQLAPGDRGPLPKRLAATLLRLQERDGSWWDYPLYDYHQPYGTAYALMALARCR